MIKRSILTYCLTILVSACIFFVPQFQTTEDDTGFVFGALVIIVSAVGMGLLALIPALASWIPLWALLERFGISPRWRAVVAAGPTALVAAFCVDFLFRKIDTGFGQVGVPPNIQEIMMVALVAAPAAYLVWTTLPEQVEIHE